MLIGQALDDVLTKHRMRTKGRAPRTCTVSIQGEDIEILIDPRSRPKYLVMLICRR